MLNLDALFAIARRNGGIQVAELVDGEVGVKLVSLFIIVQVLESLDAGNIALERPRDGGNLLDLVALAQDARHGHIGRVNVLLVCCRFCVGGQQLAETKGFIKVCPGISRLKSRRRCVGLGGGGRERSPLRRLFLVSARPQNG